MKDRDVFGLPLEELLSNKNEHQYKAPSKRKKEL